jgi:alkaline phosphatase D
LSGDSHASWVADLRRDNESSYEPVSGAGGLGVEFAGSAVSSPSSYGYGPTWDTARYNGVAANLTAATPSLQFAEGQLRGYFELELTPQNATAFYYGFTNTTNHDEEAILFGTFSTEKGSNKLTRPLNGGITPTYGALGAGARANATSTA